MAELQYLLAKKKEDGMSRAEKQVVAVTGAAAGIGYAIAERFANEGHRVAILDLDEANAKVSAETLSRVAETQGYLLSATMWRTSKAAAMRMR